MTYEVAKRLVLAKFPQAHISTRRTHCGAGSVLYTVVTDWRLYGNWLSGEHKTEGAAWLRAAKHPRMETISHE